MTNQPALIAANWERIQARIARAAERCGRLPAEITVVAVSKTHSAEAIGTAYEAGLRHFGENRVQEWESKMPKVADLDATWHLIGHLQSNKARRAAHIFRRVDSLDDLALAKKLHAAADAEGKCLPVLIEVRLGDEVSKSGIVEADLLVAGHQHCSVRASGIRRAHDHPAVLRRTGARAALFPQAARIAGQSRPSVSAALCLSSPWA